MDGAFAKFKNLMHDIVDQLPVPVEQKLRDLHDRVDELFAELEADGAEPAADPAESAAPADPRPADQAATA